MRLLYSLLIIFELDIKLLCLTLNLLLGVPKTYNGVWNLFSSNGLFSNASAVVRIWLVEILLPTPPQPRGGLLCRGAQYSCHAPFQSFFFVLDGPNLIKKNSGKSWYCAQYYFAPYYTIGPPHSTPPSDDDWDWVWKCKTNPFKKNSLACTSRQSSHTKINQFNYSHVFTHTHTYFAFHLHINLIMHVFIYLYLIFK